MQPRIVMTSPTGWNWIIVKGIVEAFSNHLKNPVIKTGRTWDGKYKLVIEFDPEKAEAQP